MTDDKQLKDAFNNLHSETRPAATPERLGKITGAKQKGWVPVFAVVLLVPVAIAMIARLTGSTDPLDVAASSTTTTSPTSTTTATTTPNPTEALPDPFGDLAAEVWRSQCMANLGHDYVASSFGFGSPFDIWFDGGNSPASAAHRGFDARYFVRPPNDSGLVRSADWWQAWDICEGQVHQESPLIYTEVDIYQLHSDTMASERVTAGLAVFNQCMADSGVPGITGPGDAEAMIREEFLSAVARAAEEGRFPNADGATDIPELIGRAIEDMKFLETTYAEAEFTCLQALELTYNEVWSSPGDQEVTELLPVIPQGSGPSQSPEDAQRDGIVPELAEFPIHERVRLQEPINLNTQTFIETQDGVWVVSRPGPVVAGAATNCELGDSTGVYGTDFICDSEYGELLLLSPDLSTILRAYPFPGLPPQWVLVQDDVVWCGRQGDGGLPSSMLCRVDSVTGELTAREFWLKHLNGFSEFGSDAGIDADLRPGTWFSSPTSEIYFGSPEVFGGELMLGGSEHIDAVDRKTLLLGEYPGTATLRVLKVSGGNGGIDVVVLARESDTEPLDFVLRDSSGEFIEATFSGSRVTGTVRGEGHVVPLNGGHRTESGWIWVNVYISELEAGSYEVMTIRGGVTLFHPVEVTASDPLNQVQRPTPEANEIAVSFLNFVDTGVGDLDLADEVTLRLGTEISQTATRQELLNDPQAWVFDVEDYNAYVGPFDILEVATRRPFVEVSEGPIPHCASPAKDYWPGAQLVLPQVNITPIGVDSCLQWFVVVLRINSVGQIQEIILDVYEP